MKKFLSVCGDVKYTKMKNDLENLSTNRSYSKKDVFSDVVLNEECAMNTNVTVDFIIQET